ncbi:MAG TPA: hypothetical protein VOA80_10160, partial [Thermoanaerobaculia bacterium]|nr:hypothetical protein [Thermoanaerobaculia bacterium]
WAGIDRSRAGLEPPIKIELASSTSEVEEILKHDDNVAKMRHQILIDNGFIVSYWLLFLGASFLFRAASPEDPAWNGGLTSLAATAAAIFDFQENNGILRSLRSYPRLSLEEVRDTREVSLLKWLLLFVVVLLLARLFVRRADGWRWIGVAMVAAAVIGICGLAWGARQPLISAGFMLALVSLLAAMALWLFWPGVFLRTEESAPPPAGGGGG